MSIKMKNNICSEAVSKLAKEKGFNLKVRSMYLNGELLEDRRTGGDYNDFKWVRTWRNSPTHDTLSAPTHAELQNYLLEKYHIFVSVVFNDHIPFEFYYFIHTNVSQPCSNRICSLPFKANSNGEAFDEGLFQALKLIENGK